MTREPKVFLACLAIARLERRRPSTYHSRRADYDARADPRAVDHGDGISVTQHAVPVDGASVGVTVYRAPTASGDAPAHVLMHGGGFCYGGPKDVDALARQYALALRGTVVTVQYRLTPEVRWPVPAEDGYAALSWTVDRAAELGVDPARVSLGGISAGGNLAAAIALMARDRGGPALVFQLLEIPVIDLTMSTGTTLDRFGRGHLLTSEHLRECHERYVPNPLDRRHAYASPIHAPDHRGLPPTLVVTAEYDPLRDEGEQYAQRLRDADVPVQVIRARGHVHSSTYTNVASAVRYRAEVAGLLARAHRPLVES